MSILDIFYTIRPLDKSEYLVMIRDNFCQFCTKTYVVTNPSSEPSHRDGSDGGSQHIVSIKNKKNYPQLSSNLLLSTGLTIPLNLDTLWHHNRIASLWRLK